MRKRSIIAVLVVSCVDIAAHCDDAGYRGASEPTTDPAVYGQGVRETEWQSPQQERDGFHIPDGFEINLFASEPDIAKPLNMAWDRQGRLWVSSTVEYPYPAKEDVEPRDKIIILEDTDGDGRADKTTTFADKLNIPMGLLPVADGVICFSIPNIWHLRDTDGDDRADERQVLLGPFDTTRDTHGMINALQRGEDGWIYACHGFNNQSQVNATDGSSVKLTSGNTFRFREDGSRIEQFTHGQVNPFGMTRDEWGNWYTADCHSKPITALLPDACYPSFGRPHDGLGFAPSMMNHLHGSTAIGGIEYYQAVDFPPAYRNRFYSGNVMTSRINCNALDWQGATAKARELPDFLTSDDPWFRPVDLQLGPDGALYVADFYNKIIGHYEVPLTHPGRDRESGRIWRIAYRGGGSNGGDGNDENHESHESDRTQVDSGSALAGLGDPNLARRRAAIENALQSATKRSGRLQEMLRDNSASQLLRLSAAEVLFRSGQFSAEELELGLRDPEPLICAHTLGLAAETAELSDVAMGLVRLNLEHVSPHVRIAAIRCVSVHGELADIDSLLRFAEDTRSDPALAQSARIAARNLLRDERVLREYESILLQSVEDGAAGSERITRLRTFALVLPGLDSKVAAESLLRFAISQTNSDRQLLQQAVELGMQHARGAIVHDLLGAISKLEPSNLVARAEWFQRLWESVHTNLSAAPEQNDPSVEELAVHSRALQQSLVEEIAQRLQRSGAAIEWFTAEDASWPTQERQCVDAQAARLQSSFPLGEAYTGTLQSEVFPCPSSLRFWLAGHNGAPDKPDHKKNFVRLSLDGTGESLAMAYPPRSDVAIEIAWDLEQHAGKQVRLAVTDGDSARAYAWLALGRFSLESLNSNDAESYLNALVSMLALRPGVRHAAVGDLIGSAPPAGQPNVALSDRQRARVLQAIWTGSNSHVESALAQIALAVDRCELLATTRMDVGHQQDETWLKIAQELSASATASEQRVFSQLLLGSTDGCELLATLLQGGWLGDAALRGHEGLMPRNLAPATRVFLTNKIADAKRGGEDLAIAANRLARLEWSSADRDLGSQLFRQHCANCHQLGGEGKLIGPQLDGAIVRGKERLAEDILLPNLNVDKAFRLSSLLLDDDSIISGLAIEQENGRLEVTKQDGQQITLQAAQVVQRRDSSNSLMPSNFAELLSDEQLVSLLKYLVEFQPHP